MSLLVFLSEPLPRFIVQLALIVLVSRALGILVRRMGQPMVIAEISAGIVLGPSLFGLVLPSAYATVFAPSSMEVLKLTSQLGLVLFMFLVGLELDPKMLRGRAQTSIAISHTSIVVPFALGSGLALFLKDRLSDPSVPLLSFSLFLGAAMSITAFPVLARILSEQRLLKTRIGAVTITCAAVDDVTAWCILAFIVANTKAAGVRGAMLTTCLALAYISIMFFAVRPLLQRVAARVSGRESLTENVAAGTLVLLFASSVVTELIGIHALFGAFLFGAVIPKEGGFARALVDRMEQLVLVLLLPLFFAYSGVRTQIGLLNSWDAWAIAGLILLVACVGKFGASTLVAKLTGLSWRESSTLGVLMNTRGLMELIVLNIGLDLGVISPTLFTMMVVMALVTTFMTTPILRLLYKPDRLVDELSEASSAEPVFAKAEFTVLVCIADDRAGPSLVTLANSLCRPGQGHVYALRLVLPSERGSFSSLENEELAKVSFAPLLKRAQALSLPIKPLSFVSADPAEDISNVAAVKHASLVLLGSHRPLLGQSLLGGTVYRVMRDTKADVGVLIDRGLTQVRRVLVPFVKTPHDLAALALARRISNSTGADICVLHILEPGAEPASRTSNSVISSTFADEGGRVDFRAVESAAPADALLEETRQGYDLVIVGLGRDFGLEQRPFGIQRERLLAECPVSLLVVRHAPTLEPSRNLAARKLPEPSAGDVPPLPIG
jgi:Kef-type K+ transport system membrane component KefB